MGRGAPFGIDIDLGDDRGVRIVEDPEWLLGIGVLREGTGEFVPSDVESVRALEKNVTGRVRLGHHGEWGEDDGTEE